MSESIFERISAFLSKKNAVQRVAEDPALASELLLLLHVVVADGNQHPAKLRLSRKLRRTILVFHRKNFPKLPNISRISAMRQSRNRRPTCWPKWPRSAVLRC
ncbi:conserved hypothetical protein [Brucella sp. NVSL 07-0026]|nr:conserved hypothetical protein [Brucella sp. NVSL 07-0026]